MQKKRSNSPEDQISPQLPEFSFVQSSSPRLGLRSETLGSDGYISRFGYGIEAEIERRASPDSREGDTPPVSATFQYSLNSQPSREDVQSVSEVASTDEQALAQDTSLDVVEDDLDYLRARMTYLDVTKGKKRDSGGPLPKRLSVRGVFDTSDTKGDPAENAAPTRTSRDTLAVPSQHPSLPNKRSSWNVAKHDQG
jgi:hypothetical protein